MAELLTDNSRAIMRERLRRWGNIEAFIEEQNDLYIWYSTEQNRIDELDATRGRNLTANMSGMPYSGIISNPTENAAIDAIRDNERLSDIYDKERAKISKICSEAVVFKGRIDSIVAEMTKEQKNIIAALYKTRGAKTPTWDEIADKTGYSADRAKHIECDAIDFMIDRWEALA